MDLTQLRDRVFKKLSLIRNVPRLNADDIDDEINMAQRQYIQLAAKLQAMAEYTTTAQDEAALLSDIAPDIYRITQINDITQNYPAEVPLLKSKDSSLIYGARLYAGILHLQGITAGRRLEVAYEQRLKDLGEGSLEVTIPEIDERWHDLYWLGALALIVPTMYYQLFTDRLNAFRKERARETSWLGGKARIGGIDYAIFRY